MLAAENPFDASLRGFAAADTMLNTLSQRQEQERANQLKAQLQAQEQAQKQAMAADLLALSQNPNPTGQQYLSVMTKYPSLSAGLKPAYEALDAQNKQNLLSQVSKINTALIKGRPDIAMSELKNQEQAYRNAGDTKTADTLASFYDQFNGADPAQAKLISGMLTASVMGADKYDQAYANIVKAQTEQDLAPVKMRQAEAEAKSAESKAKADIYAPQEAKAKATSAGYQAMADANKPVVSAAEAKIKGYEAINTPIKQNLENARITAQTNDYISRIKDRADRFGLDSEELNMKLDEALYKKTNPTLDKDARELINKNRIDAQAAKSQADQMNTLADQLDAAAKEAARGGVVARGWESVKRFGGEQNSVSALRARSIFLKNQQVVKSLPSGNTSDRDIEIFNRGVPPDDADLEYMASYLRGEAKLSALVAKDADLRADWVNEVGSLANPRRDIVVNGVTVRAGMSFSDFYRESSKIKGQAAPLPSQGRRYLEGLGG